MCPSKERLFFPTKQEFRLTCTLYNDGIQQVWKKAHENTFSASSVKHPTSVMLWGAFTATGPGLTRFLNTGERYNSTCLIHRFE